MSSRDAATGASPGDRVLEQVSENDTQDDWEYEYSTTETEVYYLTVDLSIPEFLAQPLRTPNHSRAGYYKHWLDDAENKGNPTRDNVERDDDGSGDAISMSGTSNADEAGQAIDTGVRHQGRAADKGEPVTTDDADGKDATRRTNPSSEHIQILELHSENPIISYRGHTFEGQWAEVIGTEAVLTQHGPTNPLPSLRNLAGDVDLLGACAARILTTEKKLKLKAKEQDSLAAIKEEWNINIPRGQDRTGERGHQTRFLENLIALKKKRGDTDEVTVYAKDGIGKDFKDYMHPESRTRRQRMPIERKQKVGVTRVSRASARRAQVRSSNMIQKDSQANRSSNTTSIPMPMQRENLTESHVSRGPDEEIEELDADSSDSGPGDSDMDDASGGDDSDIGSKHGGEDTHMAT